MPDPMLLAALGVSLGRLLLRAAGQAETADALGDAQEGFAAWRHLRAVGRPGEVDRAISTILERRLPALTAEDQQQWSVAVRNVSVVFDKLNEKDIAVAARNPGGFPAYVVAGRGGRLLRETEEAVTPFTEELLLIGAQVFAELAPASPRFVPGALLTLLEDVTAFTRGMGDVHSDVVAVRDELRMWTRTLDLTVAEVGGKVDVLLANSSLDVKDPVAASVRATRDGRLVGPTVREWDPRRLGVHSSITVDDEGTLVPYIIRDHDKKLRCVLRELAKSGGGGPVLVVGTSCTGKTRTLYEAVRDTLEGWAVLAPSNDIDLELALKEGVPAHTVVWLDELQKHLTTTSEGREAARALSTLLASGIAGPVVVVGTMWPNNLKRLMARPDPDTAMQGAEAIRDLLATCTIIEVPDTFTDNDLSNAPDDPRIVAAIATASVASPDDGSRKVAQVLAGGSQLVHRLYPPSDTYVLEPFSPAARAILLAAGDLRRIGFPSPLPRWALEGAAPAYAGHSVADRPLATWFESALAEVCRSASRDDAMTGTHLLDVNSEGVPALAPTWRSDSEGRTTENFIFHDYLYQDHLSRHSTANPVQALVWTQLGDSRRVDALREEACPRVADLIAFTPLAATSLGKALSWPTRDGEFVAQVAERLAALDETAGSLRALAQESKNPVTDVLLNPTEMPHCIGRRRETLPKVDLVAIDDHPLVTFFVSREVVERFPGTNVVTYSSVEEYIANPVKASLVIMDMNRHEVFRGNRGVRIMAATGATVIVFSAQDYPRGVSSAGAVEILRKDVGSDAFWAAIMKWAPWLGRER